MRITPNIYAFILVLTLKWCYYQAVACEVRLADDSKAENLQAGRIQGWADHREKIPPAAKILFVLEKLHLRNPGGLVVYLVWNLSDLEEEGENLKILSIENSA